MTSQATQKKSDPRNKAINILRVILWLLPAIVVPCGYLITIALVNIWPIAMAATLAALAVIGYIDQRFSLHKDRKDPSKNRPKTIHHTVFFILTQIVLRPMLFATIVLGLPAILDLFR